MLNRMISDDKYSTLLLVFNNLCFTIKMCIFLPLQHRIIGSPWNMSVNWTANKFIHGLFSYRKIGCELVKSNLCRVIVAFRVRVRDPNTLPIGLARDSLSSDVIRNYSLDVHLFQFRVSFVGIAFSPLGQLLDNFDCFQA